MSPEHGRSFAHVDPPGLTDHAEPALPAPAPRARRAPSWRTLAIATGGVLGLLLVLLPAWVLFSTMRPPMEAELSKRSSAVCQEMARDLRDAAATQDKQSISENIGRLEQESSVQVQGAWLFDPEYKLLGKFLRYGAPESPPDAAFLASGLQHASSRFIEAGGAPLLEVACPVAAGGNVLRLLVGTDEIRETVRECFLRALVPLAAILLVAAALQLMLVIYVLRLRAVQQQRYQETASSIARAGREMLSTIASFSTLSRETSASVTETTTTMREVSQTAKHAADVAGGVIGLASKSEQFSAEGLGAVDESGAAIAELRDEVRTVSERIGALGQRMQDVFEIASTVSELAERSNLLALNASIEAAKAGAQGKGFAVVATEMRSLAESSKKAVTQAKLILNEVQKAMLAAVTGSESGIRRAETAADLANRAGGMIKNLAAAIRESSQAATSIAELARQQSTGVDQVLASMTEINGAAIAAVDATHRADTVAHQLSSLSSQLMHAVEGR